MVEYYGSRKVVTQQAPNESRQNRIGRKGFRMKKVGYLLIVLAFLMISVALPPTSEAVILAADSQYSVKHQVPIVTFMKGTNLQFFSGTQTVKSGYSLHTRNFNHPPFGTGVSPTVPALKGRQVVFYPDGYLEACSLSQTFQYIVHHQVPVLTFRKGSTIEFYQNGAIRAGYLNNQRYLKLPGGKQVQVQKGARVQFDESGYLDANAYSISSDIDQHAGEDE